MKKKLSIQAKAAFGLLAAIVLTVVGVILFGGNESMYLHTSDTYYVYPSLGRAITLSFQEDGQFWRVAGMLLFGGAAAYGLWYIWDEWNMKICIGVFVAAGACLSIFFAGAYRVQDHTHVEVTKAQHDAKGTINYDKLMILNQNVDITGQ